MIRVLILDDHPLIREGLKKLLARSPGIKVAAEAEGGYEALEALRSVELDLVVLDLALPGPGGLEVLKQIRIERPALPVLVLSMYPEEQYAARALRCGASGYITKTSAPTELLRAIDRVMAGQTYVSEHFSSHLAASLYRKEAGPAHTMLSDREYEVMLLVAEGAPAGRIAAVLHLSQHTVRTYCARIRQKLGLSSNAQVVRYAVENRLTGCRASL